MSRKMHLVCNAHLDPVWQWEWEEGAAEALSTFRIAADFCEEYDSYVFCHNEALLYQWIEEYDLPLFEQIQSLVKRGKWHIMGGWHLQPDCNMPSGESFVRQILSGREYFLEKFGVAPTVATNVDSFGHSRGLVQILTKSGYDSYLIGRPGDGNRFVEFPGDEFRWIGYDGSEVVAIRIPYGYNSGKGEAVRKLTRVLDNFPEEELLVCLWGIGNHGGGPSKKDLDDIAVFMEEQQKQGMEIVHSTPEAYVADLLQTKQLPVFERSLNPWSPGCYTSQVRIKQRYRQLENTYYLTEIMCAHAASQGLMKYPGAELAEAVYDMITVQFHDMLPGSSIQPAEEMGLRMLDHGLEILSRVKARAFFALAAGQKKADPDKIPIFAYNPYPYPISGDFMCEFMLWDQNWKQEFLRPRLYNSRGEICPSQCEKEYSTIPLEWRKRVVFHADLAPLSMNRFDCAFDTIECKPAPQMEQDDTHFVFCRENFEIRINKSTGLVDLLRSGEQQFVQPGAFGLEVFDDNFDPWYMEETSWLKQVGQFRLLTPKEAMVFCHTDAPMDAVRVIESGAVRTVVEAVFGYNNARAVVKYLISEQGNLDLDIRIVWDEKQKMVKLNVPSCFGANVCIGEHPYGREVLRNAMGENVSQKYTAICSDDLAILAVDNGVYGSSFDDAGGSLKITLMRSPSYCAHPLEGRVTMPQDRYMPYIEQGERDFSFRFVFGRREDVLNRASRLGQHFNMKPMVLSFYPTGRGQLPGSPVSLEETDIVNITAFKQAQDGEGWIVRLFNPTEQHRTAKLRFENAVEEVAFGPFEIKTLRCSGGEIVGTDLMEGLLDR